LTRRPPARVRAGRVRSQTGLGRPALHSP